MDKLRNIYAGFLAVSLAWSCQAYAATEPLKPIIKNIEQTKQGMTLWQMIVSGGSLMIVLAFLSVITLAMIVYGLLTYKAAKLAPRDFSEDVIKLLEQKKVKAAAKMCEAQSNIISNIVLSGIEGKVKGPSFAREAMEISAKKEIGNLWQGISYLSDIANISTLVGLLGTIFGMIQAFNVIVVQSAVVKPIMLAGGISKAMITTAAGLCVAIPAMAFYSYFKGKVQEITNNVESYATEIIKLIQES